MSGNLIRTLAVLALVFTASNATAQSSDYVMEYRWLTLFGEPDHTLPTLDARAGLQPNIFESILSRAFLTLDTDGRLTSPENAGHYFREPDPTFGQPAAFRRPPQARLSFSIRF